MDCVKLLIQTKYNKICACKTIGNVKADQTVADFKELLFIFRCEHGLAVMLFKRDGWALAGVARWIECQPTNQKVASSIPGQGTCLGCRP